MRLVTVTLTLPLLGNGEQGVRRIANAFAADTLDVLISVNVLLEGVDLPEASAGIDGRIPQHPATLQQMVGRVLRAAPGKTDALWVSLAPCDHSLMTIEELVGSDTPLRVSVRTYLTEEKVPSPQKGNPAESYPWHDLLTAQGSRILGYERQALTLDRPVGHWRRSANTPDLLLETTVGVYRLEAVASSYRVQWQSPKGAHRWLADLPVAAHLAMPLAERDAARRLRDQAEQHDPAFLAGPVSDRTLTIARRMKLKNVKDTMTEQQVQRIIAAVKHSSGKTTR